MTRSIKTHMGRPHRKTPCMNELALAEREHRAFLAVGFAGLILVMLASLSMI